MVSKMESYHGIDYTSFGDLSHVAAVSMLFWLLMLCLCIAINKKATEEVAFRCEQIDD